MSAPVHGNYHGLVSPAILAIVLIPFKRYYTKRPSLNDPRLKLLTDQDPDFFSGKTVLDVGCNEGWVTCEIGIDYGNI